MNPSISQIDISNSCGVMRNLASACFCLALFILSTVSANGQCAMGFTNGTTISSSNIDGTRGTDWSDASVLRTNDPCVSASLLDWNGTSLMGSNAVPTIPRQVTVLSKRDAGFFYIAFDIEDQTRDTTVSGPHPPLTAGEKIFIQFDPNHSGGTQLNNDFRIDTSHIWAVGVSGQINLTTHFSNTGPAAICGVPEFLNTTAPTGLLIAARPTTNGYFIEFKVPLTGIGNPTTDIGVAFAVINDLGHCNGSVCDATAATFPSSPSWVTNNATDPLPCLGLVPNDWGLGFFASAPTDVTIDRTPVPWNADSVHVKECNSSSTNYTYYAANPCKIIVEGQVRNSGPATQRNLLFLWGKNGTGPNNWKFIDIKKNQAIPASGLSSFLPSSLWDGVPVGETNHPCVRVYVLPPSFRDDFDENRMRTISTQTDLEEMAMKYGLGDQHWAQKNITRHTSGTATCPTSGCGVARNSSPGRIDTFTTAEDGVSFLNASFSQLSGGGPGVMASNPVPGGPNTVLQQAPSGPVLPKTGNDIRMSREELQKFRRDHVIVQIRAFGFSHPRTGPPRYNFIEDLGGLLHLFPVEMLRRGREIPFEFDVNNPGHVPRTIFLHVDTLAPAGFEDVTFVIDVKGKEYGAGETKTLSGFVIPRKPNQDDGSNFKRWGLSLHAGVSIPHGNFSNVFDPGPNFAVDLEYRFHPLFSIEGIYGFHRFNGATIGGFTFSDVNLHQISVNGKVYGNTSPVRPFFNFGGGAYHVAPSTHGGLNVGGGLQFDVNPNFAVEGSYNFHNIFTSGSSTRFSTVQAGVRFRF